MNSPNSVVAARAEEAHARAQPGRGNGDVRALAAGCEQEAIAEHRLARARQARRVADHVGADGSADGEEAAHAALSRTSAANRSLPAGRVSHQLGMPLHRDEPRARRVASAASGSPSAALALARSPSASAPDDLVVQAVDGELAAARCARQQRAVLDAHRMQVEREARTRVVAVDVLDQIPAVAPRWRAAARGTRRAPAAPLSRAAASNASSCASRPRCTQAPSAAGGRP